MSARVGRAGNFKQQIIAWAETGDHVLPDFTCNSSLEKFEIWAEGGVVEGSDMIGKEQEKCRNPSGISDIGGATQQLSDKESNAEI